MATHLATRSLLCRPSTKSIFSSLLSRSFSSVPTRAIWHDSVQVDLKCCVVVKFVCEDDSPMEASNGVAALHVAASAIRLLIEGSQAGCLIGMFGKKIEKLRNSSGASITVLAPNQLPLCASAYESDRVVQISRDIPVVLKALEEIGCQLRQTKSVSCDSKRKQVILNC